jgi:dTDP-4-dehydrorhamnose reductase
MAQQSILLTGAAGQLGKTLAAMWPESELHSKYRLVPFTKSQLDITSDDAVNNALTVLKPAVIINCSAYTAVDKAQTDKANAYLVNQQGPANLAKYCAQSECRLLHVSTDFVFSGKFSAPIDVDAATNPAGVYGSSKLAGEAAIVEALAANSAIFRTSWLYSPYNANFVKTMLRLMAEKESLSVVADQRGAPTSTRSLSALLCTAVQNPSANGLYHWSDKADISWFDFAVEIQSQAVDLGLLKTAIPINPISTSEYPTAATRPSYSVLDCSKTEKDFAVQQSNWRDELRIVLRQLKDIGE